MPRPIGSHAVGDALILIGIYETSRSGTDLLRLCLFDARLRLAPCCRGCRGWGGLERIFVEGVEHGREITLAGIGQQRHDALAAVFGALGQ